jgi:hypothetical protein
VIATSVPEFRCETEMYVPHGIYAYSSCWGRRSCSGPTHGRPISLHFGPGPLVLCLLDWTSAHFQEISTASRPIMRNREISYRTLTDLTATGPVKPDMSCWSPWCRRGAARFQGVPLYFGPVSLALWPTYLKFGLL